VRQLVFHGVRKLAVEEAPEPEVGPDELRVAVHSVGVCGSDVHGYAGVNRRRVPGMVMGHEAVGVVVERGEQVAEPQVGTRVAINPITTCGECALCLGGDENLCERRRIYGCIIDLPGAYAESFVVKAENSVPFEGPAPVEWGALAEPLSVGAHAARISEIGRGDEALVVGGGPIGLGAALAARRRGADRVVVSEPLAHRREISERLGFETFDPGRGALERRFPVAFECVGHSVTLAAALTGVPPKGRVIFVGLAEETIDLLATPLMVGERTIKGSAAYSRDDFRDTAAWIASGEADLSPLIELRVSLDELPHVFERYANHDLDAVKTVLQFDGR
jgi:2-desacetyl-2-hydroxyethyl bacteriochlorophyllide A dehydrogenase